MARHSVIYRANRAEGALSTTSVGIADRIDESVEQERPSPLPTTAGLISAKIIIALTELRH
ncbi:hypothetical protein KAH81_01700 [bacterium]|nr:hypothetical protein [bacterium]